MVTPPANYLPLLLDALRAQVEHGHVPPFHFVSNLSSKMDGARWQTEYGVVIFHFDIHAPVQMFYLYNEESYRQYLEQREQ